MEPPFFLKGKLGLCVSVVTPVDVFMRIGGLNKTGRCGCSKVEPVIVRDFSGSSMRAEVGRGGRATALRPRMIARGLLSAVSFAALAALDPVLAEDKPVGLPEVKVIANTPLAPASPRPSARPAERAPPRVAETPPPRTAETSSRRAAVAPSRSVAPSQPAPEAVSAPADPGLIERDKIPANVQTLSAGDFDHAKAPDLLDAMSRGLPGLALGDQTGNEFQRDINYRGFTASPVIGTPQGLAVYQNGVRVNEVFGDIVNWDFIPETAINRMTLMPSNPVYGLNALGGALSIDMKNGFTYQGTETELRGGSFGRRSALVQTGGQAGNLSGYLTADAINDDGWRLYSPSYLRRIYGDLGARGEQTEFHVTFTGASNNFGAAAATPIQLLNRNWASVYTLPQTTGESAGLSDRKRQLEPGRYFVAAGKRLLSRFLATPRRWQRDRCTKRWLPPIEICLLSRSQRHVDESHRPQRPSGSRRRHTGRQRPGRDRPHLDRGQQLRRLIPGGDQRQDLRPEQPFCHRRKQRQRPRSVRHYERARNDQSRSVSLRARRRDLHQSTFR